MQTPAPTLTLHFQPGNDLLMTKANRLLGARLDPELTLQLLLAYPAPFPPYSFVVSTASFSLWSLYCPEQPFAFTAIYTGGAMLK